MNLEITEAKSNILKPMEDVLEGDIFRVVSGDREAMSSYGWLLRAYAPQAPKTGYLFVVLTDAQSTWSCKAQALKGTKVQLLQPGESITITRTD